MNSSYYQSVNYQAENVDELKGVVETESIIRPRSSVLENDRLRASKRDILGGFHLENGDRYVSSNIINVNNERGPLPGDYFTQSFNQYENYVEPEGIRKGVSTSYLRFQ
jgi:hypothetical protein